MGFQFILPVNQTDEYKISHQKFWGELAVLQRGHLRNTLNKNVHMHMMHMLFVRPITI